MEVWAVGGYSEIGRNMTALRIGKDVIILDMGIWVEKVAAYEDGDAMDLPVKRLYQMDVVPDDELFKKTWGKDVKAIVISHAHLDHSAATPVLAPRYKAPVLATPFTTEVIRNLIREQKKPFPNQLIKIKTGEKYRINKDLSIEFIHTTHSTPQTAMIAVHSSEGTVLYAVDWKYDSTPLMGPPIDVERLRVLGEDGIKAFFTDTTRVDRESKTYSEVVEKEMLREVLMNTETKNKLILVTTFASHISRIKTVMDIAKEMGRKVVILGRSMKNYIDAAERVGLVNISKKGVLAGNSRDIKKALEMMLREGKDGFIVISTGNQGEPNSVLAKILNGFYPYVFSNDDMVVFATETIPSPVNMANRAEIERKLKSKHIRIFKDVHVSGHAAREDQRDMLKILRPEHYIPTHGTIEKIASAISMASEEGYILGKNAHMLQNGQRLEI
jgi:ribonuclease J